MSRPAILILGGAGMLGHKLFQFLRSHREGVVCTVHAPATGTPLERVSLLHGSDVIAGVDVMDRAALEQTLVQLRPDVVINCVGIIKQRDQATDALPSIAVNALLPHVLANVVAGWGGRVIHFSTDCVFSGRNGPYRETDPSDAEDLYGKSKFLGEVVADNALTLRSSIIGRELKTHRSLLDWFLSQNHRTVRGFRRVIYGGTTTNQMAEVVAMILRSYPTLSGLFQVASPPISKHDLLTLIREAYGLEIIIEPDDTERSDRSLVGDKLCEATGYVSPSWPDLVTQLAADPTPYDQWTTA